MYIETFIVLNFYINGTTVLRNCWKYNFPKGTQHVSKTEFSGIVLNIGYSQIVKQNIVGEIWQ